jgi:hypothetical protein
LKAQWIVIAVVITVLAFGFLRSRNASTRESMDGKTLVQLAKAGSDIKKLHNIDFFFYFPTQDEAEKAAPKLAALGLSTKMDRAAKGSNWVIHGTKTMVPSEVELERLRRSFDEIATAQSGDYDGWGAEVVN